MISLKRVREVLTRHLCFIGPGLVASVAYVDPGNWATDLQAGAQYGSKLLFIVLVAGLAAVVVQILSVRLGAVTSKSLPRATRELILSWEAAYPKYRLWFRALLYSLWALAEIAIIATDLAELLGSAIALNMLFPTLPLYAGVLITAADVLIVLLFFRSDSGRQGMLLFEIVIVALVLAVFVSFMILLHLIQPPWREIFLGLVPSKTLFKPGALYIGVGIIGATVMPHALFLGSHLACVDRLGMLPVPPSRKPKRKNNRLPSLNPLGALRRRRNAHPAVQDASGSVEMERVNTCRSSTNSVGPDPLNATRPDPLQLENEVGKEIDKDEDEDYETAVERYNADVRAFDRIRWVDLHVKHATVDTAYSLLGFALTINSAILTLAAAAYFYADNGANADEADLFGAHALIKDYVGNGAGLIFALALLCAGQSASITATLAGQVVSEGFLEWRTSPMVRRLITRLIGVIPAAVVASAVGPKGLDTMLVASQVVLCIVLPTVTIPLVYLCSRSDIMAVDGPVDETQPVPVQDVQGNLDNGDSSDEQDETKAKVQELEQAQAKPDVPVASSSQVQVQVLDRTPSPTPPPQRRRKLYTSPRWVTALGYLLCGVVILANGYVIVQLGLGNG